MVASFELKNEWLLQRCGEFRVAVEINLDEKEIVLGRGQNRGVRYPLGVSRRHALLTRAASDQWKIKDLGSTNGLFINSTKVGKDSFVLLREYDIIGLGIADATCEDHYSFLLCRRIKIHHYRLPELAKTEFPTSTFVRDDHFPEKEELVDVPTRLPANVENCDQEELTDDDICVVPGTPKNNRKQKAILISDESDSSDIEIICVKRKRRRQHRKRSLLVNGHRRGNEFIKIARRHKELLNCESTNVNRSSQIPYEVNRIESPISIPDTSRPGNVEVISSKISERNISMQASQPLSSFDKCNGIEKFARLQYCGIIEILDDGDADSRRERKSQFTSGDKCSAFDTEEKSLNGAPRGQERVPSRVGFTTYHDSNDYEVPIADTVDDSFVQDNSFIGIDEDVLRSRIVWSAPDDDYREHTSPLE